MTYDQFITNILMSRGRNNCYKNDSMTPENHHIIPKCMGGDNDKSNLILLYPREHYEAHKLLALENPNNRALVSAWWCISHLTKGNHEVTAQEYEDAKNALAKIHSTIYSGEGNPFYGKKHTTDTKQKMKDNHALLRGANHPRAISVYCIELDQEFFLGGFMMLKNN